MLNTDLRQPTRSNTGSRELYPRVSEQPDPELCNVVAALAAVLTDRMTQATELAAGRGGQAPAALVSLREFLGGGTIEQLRQTLGLSHSAAVRLVDRLVADGQVIRREGLGDARTVALTLTPAGRSAVRRILSARSAVIEEAVASLALGERDAIQSSANKMLAAIAKSRLEERAAGASTGHRLDLSIV